MTDSDAERRVWDRLPGGAREPLTTGLSQADLTALLLGVARRRAAAVAPGRLLRRWTEDRFVRPADVDPRVLARIEARMWELLPAEVDGVELSPVVPLGACTAVAPLSQNRVVTTMRGTEVVSDSTNALAIEAAARRKAGAVEVHLAASHRQLRAQVFPPGWAPHFRLFALVSSARDTGSGATQARLLTLHVRFWRRVLAEFAADADPRMSYTVFDSPVVRERIEDTVLPALQDAAIDALVEDPAREHGQGYYVDAALRITVSRRDAAGVVELGDGGFTTWTAQLTGNAKERCLVSCLSSERLAALYSG
jgi:hypothetical protein